MIIRCKVHIIDKLCAEHVANSSDDVGREELEEFRERLQLTVSYGDIGRRVYGAWCYQLVQFAVGFTQFNWCIVYFIFVANTVYVMFPLREVNSSTPIPPTSPRSAEIDEGIHGIALTRSNSTISYVSTAPDLRIVVLWSIPFLICTSLVRKVRFLAPLSSVASVALVLGMISVAIFLVIGK